MLKRIAPVLVVCLMAAILGGCACTGTGMTATPAPTMQPTTTPQVSPETSAMPDTASENPSIGGSGTENSNGSDLGTGADSGLSAVIPDFMEGMDVQATDVPEITKAVQEKYPNAEIVSIRHAMVTEQQVYAVVIKTSGTEKTVYVQPDGSVLEEDGANSTGQQ